MDIHTITLSYLTPSQLLCFLTTNKISPKTHFTYNTTQETSPSLINKILQLFTHIIFKQIHLQSIEYTRYLDNLFIQANIFSNLRFLTHITITNTTKVSNHLDISILSECQKLLSLTITNYHIIYPIKLKFPSLHTLFLPGCTVCTSTDTQFQQIFVPTIRHLHLPIIYKLDDNFKMFDIIKNNTKLKSLHLTLPHPVRPLRPVLQLSNHTKLTKLGISNFHTPNLPNLPNIPNLRTLNLINFAYLTNINAIKYSNLKHITFQNCKALQNVDGLTQIPTLRTCTFQICPELLTIRGLYASKSLHTLHVIDCPRLDNLTGVRSSLRTCIIQNCESFTWLIHQCYYLQFISITNCPRITFHHLNTIRSCPTIILNGQLLARTT